MNSQIASTDGFSSLASHLGSFRRFSQIVSCDVQGFFTEFLGFLRSMNKDEATVLVVSHGGTIAAILRYLAAEQGRRQSKFISVSVSSMEAYTE